MAKAAAPSHPCRTHPSALAGWECSGCGAWLCPDCVAISGRSGTVDLLQCTLCGDAPRKLTVHRKAHPYRLRLLSVWRYPLSRSGLISLSMAGLFMAWVFGQPWLAPFGVAVFYAYLFNLVRQTAAGSEEIEPPEVTDVWPDLLAPALRGLVSSSLLLLPALLYLHTGRAWELKGLLSDPVFWLLWAVGQLYLPIALIMAATGGGLRLLNPVEGFIHAARLGADYLYCVLAIAGLGVLQLLLAALAVASHAFEYMIPFGWVAWIALLYVPFVMARVLGLLLYTRGDEVGYGPRSDYEAPLVTEPPRGTPRPSV